MSKTQKKIVSISAAITGKSEVKATLAPLSAELTATLIPAETAEAPVIDCGVFDKPASETTPTQPSAQALALNRAYQKAEVVAAEVHAIEARASRTLVLAADIASKMHVSLDAALATNQIPKAFVEDIRDQLALLAEVTLLAICASNLSNRVEAGDLAPRA